MQDTVLARMAALHGPLSEGGQCDTPLTSAEK